MDKIETKFLYDKINYEDKTIIFCERKIKNLYHIYVISMILNLSIIKYLIRLIDIYGYDILRTNCNKYYVHFEKEQIIKREFNGENLISFAVGESLSSSGILVN